MAKKAKKITLNPPEGGWLRRGEEIKVRPGSHLFIMLHDVDGPSLEAALQPEVRKFLLSGEGEAISGKFSTCVLYQRRKYDLEVTIKQSGIRAQYEIVD